MACLLTPNPISSFPPLPTFHPRLLLICLFVFTHSENQQFLKDMTTSVLEGRGVGFLKQGRFKKLMEDENYRNFVVSRLNTALEKKLTDENQHLDDVVRHT